MKHSVAWFLLQLSRLTWLSKWQCKIIMSKYVASNIWACKPENSFCNFFSASHVSSSPAHLAPFNPSNSRSNSPNPVAMAASAASAGDGFSGVNIQER